MVKQYLSFLTVLFCLPILVLSQHSPFCSKYKIVTPENRLAIEDHRSDSVDITHTDITLDMTNLIGQQIEGIARLDLRSKVSSLSHIRLDFEGLTVDSLTGADVSSFVHQDSFLVVNFTSPLVSGTETSISVHYSGSPMKDASGWGGFYFSGAFSWNLGVGFADDPHSYGRIWFPCFDNFIERSTFDFHVTVAAEKMASCNGILVSSTQTDSTRTFHWSLEQPIPSYLACVAVGNYKPVIQSVNAVNGPLPIEIYGRSTDSSNIVASFTHLSNAILAYEDAYGEYRFDKVGYSLVPFNSGAMEHATNITYPISAANGGLAQEDLMAHELGHMWWGDNITCQTDGDMWINEGWASFSEFLFQQAVYGDKAYEEAMLVDLRRMLQFGHHDEESYRAVSGQPHKYVYGDHVYKKGALVAYNLRGYMGDEAFFDAIHQFMEQFKYSSVSSDSLEKYFTLYSGIDLEPFFRDWVFSGGYNVVLLDSFTSIANGNEFDVDLYLQQKLKGRSEYHDGVPVFYTIYDNEWNTESGKFTMSGNFDQESITTSIQPAHIILYANHEQAQARTMDKLVVSESGSYDLNNMMWDVKVESVEDSALVFFEHVWSSPDAIKEFETKAYRLSGYHYWKVSGLDMDNVEMSAKFLYDGRLGGSTGFMDIELVSIQEDSLVLLFRSGSHSDWSEYEFYQKDVLGVSINGFGRMELSKVLPGEYTLANRDQSVLSTDAVASEIRVEVYPNPVKQELNIVFDEFDPNKAVSFKVYDSKGSVVLNQRITDSVTRINTIGLTAGAYSYSIAMEHVNKTGKFIVSH